MGNLIVNIRIGVWHFQIERRPFRTSFTRNDWHTGRKSPWLEIYAPFYLAIGGRP